MLEIIFAGVEDLPQVMFCLPSVQMATGGSRWILVFEDSQAGGYVGRDIGGGVERLTLLPARRPMVTSRRSGGKGGCGNVGRKG